MESRLSVQQAMASQLPGTPTAGSAEASTNASDGISLTTNPAFSTSGIQPPISSVGSTTTAAGTTTAAPTTTIVSAPASMQATTQSVAPGILNGSTSLYSNSIGQASNLPSSSPTTLFTTPTTTTGSLTSTSSNLSSISQRTSTMDLKTSSVMSYTEPSTLPTMPPPEKSHHLADGTVAGVVIGVAVGTALITFLMTFLFMRRKRNPTGRAQTVMSQASNGPGHQSDKKSKHALMTRSNRNTLDYERYLPPSADDKAIEQRTRNTFDQIELHVENYYQNFSNPSTRPNSRELASLNSPYLPQSLASMLSHSRDADTLIKHVLAYLVISSISPSAKTGSTLLPAEFAGLPTSAASTEFGTAFKPGFDRCMSRWRVLGAYLRPDPAENTLYTAARDRQISELTQLFSRSLAAWKNPKYKDDDRMRHLSALAVEAADLGIWLFSQPSAFEFRWSRRGENEIDIAPALVKLTDEKGNKLAESQILIKATTSKLKSQF